MAGVNKTKNNILITQSNYIPWKGYFDAIALADTFVVYDDMQYTRRDWRNRNLIKTPRGLEWLTVPVEVKGKYFQAIRETKISDRKWIRSHCDSLKQNYKLAGHYAEIKDFVEDLYMSCSYDYLTEVNMHFIAGINKFLGIDTPVRYSSEFTLDEERTQRLVNICEELGGTDYYSGPAAKAYMDESKFEAKHIKVHYFDYSGYAEYPQLHGAFEHGVSVLDLLFNTGSGAKKYMKFIA